MSFKYTDSNRLKVKVQSKIQHANTTQKKAGISISQHRVLPGIKKDIFTTTKWFINQEDLHVLYT